MRKKSKKNQYQISQNQQSQPQVKKQYVEAKRKKKAPKQTQQTIEDQSQDVLDIHHGDSFIRQHIRPSFLKRWDGQSNTLQLTQDQLGDMSPMLKVYWQYKSKNMNCIIFVQIGTVQFYAFEDDAIKLHQIFKKRLKRYSDYLMVNFWFKQIQLAKLQLFQRRIPVLVMNQIQDEQYKKNFGILKRQITEVITPSIYLTMEPKKFRQRMMLCLFVRKNKCGVCCVDVQTNHFYLEQYEGSQNQIVHQIRRLMNKYRPAELVIEKKNDFIKRIAKQICQPFIVQTSAIPETLFQTIKTMKQLSDDQIFKRIMNLYIKQSVQQQQKFSLYPIVKVLSLILNYMRNLTLQAKIFGQGIFQICDSDTVKFKPMFDAQVYQNLEVFNLKDQEDSFGKPGTLYHYLNHCLTNSGQKLLKKWIDQPLRTIHEISKRQIAIQNLLQNNGQLLLLHKQLLKFQKLERRVGNIYHWALNQGDQGKLILTKQLKFHKDYDPKKNPAVTRIKQIYDILKLLSAVQVFFTKFSKHDIQSQLLKRNCKLIEGVDLYRIQKRKLQQITKKGLPSIEGLVNKLISKIHIDENSGHIQPAKGISEVFDNQKQQIDRINQQFQQILSKWKKKLGVTKAFYVSVRARNQIQVPLSQVRNKKYPQLIFSSQTTKMIRYVTAQTSNLSQQLIQHEEALAIAYQPFAAMMIKQFCSHKHIWDLYISAISKLDVLISLAKTSAQMAPRCLPIFKENILHVVNGYHVGLLQVLPHDKIVPNSLFLENDQKILLLTGPNMGGKSTLLRQTCLLAILAQIGCFLPCQKYQSIIFDQIFCRIGASDRIIQGKSTFYVQLEQTKRIIDQATPNSLVIIDQLGRGTSTYDGMAIASSILRYISQQIQCYTLFSTHYFPITEQYHLNPNILCGRIGYTFNEDKKQIKFTYQLEKGIAKKSFANQVAAQVGLSKETLQIAQKKAHQIQVTNNNKRTKENLLVLDEIQRFLGK